MEVFPMMVFSFWYDFIILKWMEYSSSHQATEKAKKLKELFMVNVRFEYATIIKWNILVYNFWPEIN